MPHLSEASIRWSFRYLVLLTMITSNGGMMISVSTATSVDCKARHQISKLDKSTRSELRKIQMILSQAYRSTAHPTNQAHLCSLFKVTPRIGVLTASTVFFNSAKAFRRVRCPNISLMLTKGASVTVFPITNRDGGV